MVLQIYIQTVTVLPKNVFMYIHIFACRRIIEGKVNVYIFKPGMHLISWNCFGLCVYVCVSSPKGINNQWHDMVWYRPYVIG